MECGASQMFLCMVCDATAGMSPQHLIGQCMQAAMQGSPDEVQPFEEVLTQREEEAAPAPRTPAAKRDRPAAPKTPPKTKAGSHDASDFRVLITVSTGMCGGEPRPHPPCISMHFRSSCSSEAAIS